MMNATKWQLECFAKKIFKMFDGTEYGEKVEDEYYKAIHGDHFTEDTLENALSEMHNEDGTIGGHWDVQATTGVAKSNGIMFDHFNEYDWNYTMNMIYSDYGRIVGDSVDTYVRMAKAFLFDKDAPEGKAYRYWKAMKH